MKEYHFISMNSKKVKYLLSYLTLKHLINSQLYLLSLNNIDYANYFTLPHSHTIRPSTLITLSNKKLIFNTCINWNHEIHGHKS